MAIITKPSTINKGSPAQITLSKSELKAHPAITDAFFQDDTNWKTVSIEYKNAQGQKKQLVFNSADSVPSDTFLASTKARSDFEVQSITIFDKDGGVFKIPATALTAAEFKLGFIPEPVLVYTRDFSSPAAFSGADTTNQSNMTSGGFLNIAANGNNLTMRLKPLDDASFAYAEYGLEGHQASLVAGKKYRIRFHVADITGTFGSTNSSDGFHISWSNQSYASQKLSASQLSSAVGSYLEMPDVTINNTSGGNWARIRFQYISNAPGNGSDATLKISKIEILEIPEGA